MSRNADKTRTYLRPSNRSVGGDLLPATGQLRPCLLCILAFFCYDSGVNRGAGVAAALHFTAREDAPALFKVRQNLEIRPWTTSPISAVNSQKGRAIPETCCAG